MQGPFQWIQLSKFEFLKKTFVRRLGRNVHQIPTFVHITSSAIPKTKMGTIEQFWKIEIVTMPHPNPFCFWYRAFSFCAQTIGLGIYFSTNVWPDQKFKFRKLGGGALKWTWKFKSDYCLSDVSSFLSCHP